MSDPKGLRQQHNAVESNSIFREHVAKEKRHAYLNENFDFNPKHLFAVTEKPTRSVVDQQGEEMDLLKTKLGSLQQKPK